MLLGRISPNKGQDILLDAIAALSDRHKAGLELRIVGSAFENPDAERALRERAAAPELAGTTRVEPFTAETAPLYRWADIVVVPSRFPEPLGRVAIEAMAHARPPLVSAIGGLVEIVADERTGWLVPPGRADALAATLRRILDDPAAWRGFGAAARARYLEVFSAEAVAADIVAFVAARPPRAPAASAALGTLPHAT